MRHAHVRSVATAALAALALALAACGDDGGAAPPDAAIDAPPGQAREVIGGIDIAEQRHLYVDEGAPAESRSASVRAAFYDGRPPRWHREVMRAGACVLKRYTPSLCEPACTTGLCVEPDVCEPFPSLVAAGRLLIDGLAVAIRIAGADGFYYPDNQLPTDLFADAATITAELIGGGGIPGLTLTTTGVPPLGFSLPFNRLTLLPGRDATVAWTPAAGDARIHLTLNANNLGHGMPYLGIIECDVADAAGEVTIAAALIDGFPETQAWTFCAGSDCPPSSIRRYHRATTPVGDRDVELTVASEVTFGVEHVLPD